MNKLIKDVITKDYMSDDKVFKDFIEFFLRT